MTTGDIWPALASGPSPDTNLLSLLLRPLLLRLLPILILLLCCPRARLYCLAGRGGAMSSLDRLVTPAPAHIAAWHTCYAMLCYAMLCCAMLCYAVLCYAMLCHAML